MTLDVEIENQRAEMLSNIYASAIRAAAEHGHFEPKDIKDFAEQCCIGFVDMMNRTKDLTFCSYTAREGKFYKNY